MIFMSQSAITTPEREGEWDRWYLEHLRIMVTVPGISSAQRFKTTTPDYPRSLAIYSIASAEVFVDPYYQSIRGLGEWLNVTDRRYYRRNLFHGLNRAPAVREGDGSSSPTAARPSRTSVALSGRGSNASASIAPRRIAALQSSTRRARRARPRAVSDGMHR